MPYYKNSLGTPNKRSPGVLQPFNFFNPDNVVAKRAPNANDAGLVGQFWFEPVNNVNAAVDGLWFFSRYNQGVPVWVQVAANGGGASFSSLTVTPGPTSITGSFTLIAGTNTVHLADDAAAHEVIIGSNTGAAEVLIQGGTGGINLQGAVAAPITIGAAAQTALIDVGVSSATNAVNVGTGAGATTLGLGSSAGASATNIKGGTGGISLSAAGLVSVVPATGGAASPSAAATINARVGVATFTGFTTASAGTQAFTITNSEVLATSGLFVSVACPTTGAELTVTGVQQLVGSFVVNVTNNGGSAVAGNILISFWCIS